MSLIRITLFLAIIVSFFSCSSTFKVKQPDPETGRFRTDTKLNESAILVDESINLNDYNEFLYIRKSGVNMEKYEDYTVGTLKSIGGFDKFYTQTELEQFVIERQLTDRVTSVSDNIGLLNLQKQVGNFLICETTAEYLGGYTYSFRLKVINPANAKVLLDLKHQALNWSGLDRPLFNPVFNYYIDWLNKNRQ